MVMLIDTIPSNARNTGSINLGYNIAQSVFGLSYFHYSDPLLYTPEKIYANVFYATHIVNLVSFLKRNKIPVLKENRQQKLIVGGQGVSNTVCLSDIANEVFKGEADGDIIDSNGWNRLSEIDTEPKIKNGKAVIELTRGCKYKCKFCEYSHVHGGKYREKDIDLVKRQIISVLPKTSSINFMSANIGSYSSIDELMDYCDTYNINVLNSDVCIRDIKKTGTFVNNTVKVGVESFNENTRKFAAKPISDDFLMEFFERSILQNNVSNIHLYLIFGLPNENYESWFPWLKEISELRKRVKRPVRVEFNLTNFEPCLGTPFENYPTVNFDEKNIFLETWSEKLIEYGFRKDRDGQGIDYSNARGRFGRKEKSYEMLMAIKRRDDITNAFLSSLHSGVGRSISDRQAESFLKLIGTDIDYQYMDKVRTFPSGNPVQIDINDVLKMK